MPSFGEWVGPHALNTKGAYNLLNEVPGLYCITLSGTLPPAAVKRQLGYASPIAYVGSGHIGKCLLDHTNPESESGTRVIRNLLRKSVPLEFHYLPIADATDEDMKGCLAGLIKTFQDIYGKKPKGNEGTPSVACRNMPQHAYHIIALAEASLH